VEPPADPYTAACPSRQVIDRIGDRWTVLILGALTDAPMRFTELARRIEGISQKMLTQTLRGLERDGMVTRTVHATVPVRVDYELTELGRTLTAPIAALEAWARDHIGDVVAARERYDQRADQVG
jgi:DNA-binding HxlR family transcriptional regulator